MQKIYNHVGIWKFSNKVTLQELEAVAMEWSKDENYLSVNVRKCSQDQYGIGFEYKNPLGTDTPETLDQYRESTSDSLKKKFGNGLVGWDISSMYYKIK
jgi:hypothetical protein